MPDKIELVNILHAVIKEELNPVNERLSSMEAGQQELRHGMQELRQDVQELKKGQATIEASVNDLRATNRRTVIM